MWLDLLPEPLAPRACLPGARDVDVAIVGAGFTGLWTAYYLAEADPGLRIVVLEAEVAGYGASGRNGDRTHSRLSIPLVLRLELLSQFAGSPRFPAPRSTTNSRSNFSSGLSSR